MVEIATRLLPLGSIVWARGGQRRLMIVARALMLTVDGETSYFEYGACVYPEGVIGDSMLYLNTEDITEVVYEGFTDEEDEAFFEQVRATAESVELTKGDTDYFRQRAMDAYLRQVRADG